MGLQLLVAFVLGIATGVGLLVFGMWIRDQL